MEIYLRYVCNMNLLPLLHVKIKNQNCVIKVWALKCRLTQTNRIQQATVYALGWGSAHSCFPQTSVSVLLGLLQGACSQCEIKVNTTPLPPCLTRPTLYCWFSYWLVGTQLLPFSKTQCRQLLYFSLFCLYEANWHQCYCCSDLYWLL